MRRLGLAIAAASAALLLCVGPSAPTRRVLDKFEDVSDWRAAPSDGVRLALSPDAGERGQAMRMDFDFGGHAGWAAARKAFPLSLPPNWVLTLRLRGKAPPQAIEVKLLDRSGENVWWSVRRPFEFPREWTTLQIRKRQVSFAWGPAGGGELHELGFIELAITAGEGGRGTVWLDELALEELPAAAGPLSLSARASSSLPGAGPERAVDGDPGTTWHSAPGSGDAQEIVLDSGEQRELGGLVLDWDRADFPRRYAVELSEDGKRWSKRREISSARGGRASIYLPDSDARFVRLSLAESARGEGYALAEASVRPPEFSQTPTVFLQNLAHDAPRGSWPRSFSGQQLYWAIVGVDGGRDQGLLSEDGALEAGRGGFSIEPFLLSEGQLLGWADADISQGLERGDLPLPRVTRHHRGGLELEIAALADGLPGGPTLLARYRVRNRGPGPASARLLVALRPLQVDPPWQFLNLPGGFSPIRSVTWDGRVARVNGDRDVVPLTPPTAFGASAFDGAAAPEWLSGGALFSSASAFEPDGLASAALAWDLTLPPGGAKDVALAVPLAGGSAIFKPPAEAAADFETRLDAATRSWESKLDRVAIELPPAADPFTRTLKSSLGWILLDRDGPALRPGCRSYARSWIRDGALISAALLRLSHAEEVREYLRWYAPYEYPDGKVPCCVDTRGSDPVPENDSPGELLFLAGEYARFTEDRKTLEEVWPFLAKAAAYIDTLRGERRTAFYRAGEKLSFFGLLPESISHEGYSAKPVHSYWDDFWALRGLSDAAQIARLLGHETEARRFEASLEELRQDLHASIKRVIVAHGIDFVPGSADLADLDAASTAIALSPGEEASRLPRRELMQTFERYWESFLVRRSGVGAAEAYTPYEWRIVGSLVRLGLRERAVELAEFLLADRRPAAWNQWPEVVWRDPRAPKFVGDLPHGWVAAEFIRSFTDLFAYERPEDQALVLGAGVPQAWLRSRPGVRVRGLRTRWGRLDLAIIEEKAGLRFSVSGDLALPPGGVALRPPLTEKPQRVTVNGRTVPFSGGELLLRKLPADVLFEKQPPVPRRSSG